MRTRVGAKESAPGGNEEARSNGLHSERGRSGELSGNSSNARGAAPESTSSQHYDRDAPVPEKTWFDPVEELDDHLLSDCPGGVCPVPWATAQEELSPGVTTTLDIVIDNVNHPDHYAANGSIECIEAIEAQLTREEYRGYLKGNIAKYVWREKKKGQTESLKKAEFYLKRLIELDESTQ